MPQVCEFLETHIFPQDPSRAGAPASQAAAGSAPPPKVLLFAHHRTVMDRLHMHLQGYDAAGQAAAELRQVRPAVGHVRIDGSTEHSLRAEMQHHFNNDPSCAVCPPLRTPAACAGPQTQPILPPLRSPDPVPSARRSR